MMTDRLDYIILRGSSCISSVFVLVKCSRYKTPHSTVDSHPVTVILDANSAPPPPPVDFEEKPMILFFIRVVVKSKIFVFLFFIFSKIFEICPAPKVVVNSEY